MDLLIFSLKCRSLLSTSAASVTHYFHPASAEGLPGIVPLTNIDPQQQGLWGMLQDGGADPTFGEQQVAVGNAEHTNLK
jgi:hypothetical protein